MLRIGKGLNANGILTIEVRHDDWCDVLMKGGTGPRLRQPRVWR